MVSKRFPEVELVRLDRNIGYSAGINEGVKRASANNSDFVWVFNNDVVVEPDCLKELVEVMASDASVGVAGPLVMDFASNKIAHAGYKIDLWTGRMMERKSPPGPKPYEVDSAFGCSNLIRMKVIDQIGEFDPRYNVYFDETDFNVRARKAGWKVMVVPSAKVRHEESATMNMFLLRKASLLLRNLIRFELKNARPAQLAVFFPYFLFVHLPIFFVLGTWYFIKLRWEAHRV
jgi:GT2 family glycosyltransferase